MRRLCVIAFALLFSQIASAAQDCAGDWIGQLNSGFKVRLHFDKNPSGYTGYLTNPSGNRTDLDQIACDTSHLHFAVTKLNLSYDGSWNTEQNAWTGTLNFQQLYPLTLSHATAADLAPAVHRRPQEAAILAGPRPYLDKDITFDNPASHNRLAGTLSLPSGAGPFPAVVLISGTGHNTRDEDVWGHKVFLVLADALCRKGIAVLRYDKRGVGSSTGDYDGATTADFTSDADAAVTWLRAQQNIDAHRVGVLGHSEGGIIAPAAADEDKNIGFVVMIAGPALRGDHLFVLQSATTAKTYGAPDDYIARRKIFDQKLYDSIIAAPSQSAALEAARKIVAEGAAEKLVDQNEAGTLSNDATSRWERYFLANDPAPVLARLKVPVLAIYGSLDVQVPAAQNSEVARRALNKNPKATVVVLPGHNHLLQQAKTGGPNEYNDIEETVSPVALKTITDWVSTTVQR